MKDRHTGVPRGFGFITYADPSVVDKVIEDPHVFNGKQVRIFVKALVVTGLFFCGGWVIFRLNLMLI